MKKLFITALALGMVLSAGPGLAQSKKMAAQMLQQHLLDAKDRQETKETLDPRLFARNPYVSRTYEIAKEIPGVLDKVFCYCYCEMNPRFKHKSLLTCFTDDHGANCGICMRQAMDSYQMSKAGKTPGEIAEYFKAQYLR